MTTPAFDDDADAEKLDPAMERVRRKLVRFIIINLGLLFIAVMAVALAIVYKSRSPAPEVPRGQVSDIQVPAWGGMLGGEIVLPAGAEILSQSLSGNRVSLMVELADGGRAVFLFDMVEGRMIGQFSINAH